MRLCKECMGKELKNDKKNPGKINQGKNQGTIIREMSRNGFMLITEKPDKFRVSLRKLRYNNYFGRELKTYQTRIGIRGYRSIFLIYFPDRQEAALKCLLDKFPEIKFHPQRFNIFQQNEKDKSR